MVIYTFLFFILSILSTEATYPGNNALSFDGVQSILKIGHMYTDLGLSGQWTLEAWIKPDGNQATMYQPNIVGFPRRHPNLELCGNSPTQLGCPGTPFKSLTQLREQNGNYYSQVGTNQIAYTPNTWYHIAATWDNVTLSTYVNGNLDSESNPYTKGYTQPFNCSFLLCDEGIDIGGYRFLDDVSGNIYSNQYFKGVIDEVRVWSVGRSNTDIIQNKDHTLTGSEAGLVYYWRFDEGAGLLINSMAFASYGTLGGGITSAEPRWVQSDCPITNPFPAPSPPGPMGGSCQCNEAGVYVAGTILGLVFIIVGVIVGIMGYKRIGNYQQLK